MPRRLKSTLTPEQMRVARAAANAVSNGAPCPSMEEANKSQLSLKKASKAGSSAATSGCALASIAVLMSRNNYDEEQATAYRKAFEAAQSSPEIQALRKARTIPELVGFESSLQFSP